MMGPIKPGDRFDPERKLRRIMADNGLAIHHLDGDPTNNDLANLVCVPIRMNEQARKRP